MRQKETRLNEKVREKKQRHRIEQRGQKENKKKKEKRRGVQFFNDQTQKRNKV